VEQLLWFDMEMTGLDADQDRPLEVACLVTGADFEILGKDHWVVGQTDEVLNGMNEWCQKHHGASGLSNDVRAHGVPESQVDEALCEWVGAYWSKPSKPIVLAGNSIHQDRLFVNKYFPQFAKKLHYRMLDVSSYKIFFESHLKKRFEKNSKHRAFNDVLDSLQEFLFYMKSMSVKN